LERGTHDNFFVHKSVSTRRVIFLFRRRRARQAFWKIAVPAAFFAKFLRFGRTASVNYICVYIVEHNVDTHENVKIKHSKYLKESFRMTAHCNYFRKYIHVESTF